MAKLCLRSWFTGHQRNQRFITTSTDLLVNAHSFCKMKKITLEKTMLQGPCVLIAKKKRFVCGRWVSLSYLDLVGVYI